MKNEQASLPSWFMECGVLKTPQQIQYELSNINRLVSRYCFDSRVDKPSLVTTIWLECASSGPLRVRSRVIDAIRACSRRFRAESQSLQLHSTIYETHLSDIETINRLARIAGLSQSEHEILYLRFWRSEDFSTIAKRLGCSVSDAELKLRSILRRLWLASQNDGL